MDCFEALPLAMTRKKGLVMTRRSLDVLRCKTRDDKVKEWIASSLMLLAMTNRERARNDNGDPLTFCFAKRGMTERVCSAKRVGRFMDCFVVSLLAMTRERAKRGMTERVCFAKRGGRFMDCFEALPLAMTRERAKRGMTE